MLGVTDVQNRMKEFELEDPDGYQLWFGEDTVEPQRQPG
jgi:hypothetical protein